MAFFYEPFLMYNQAVGYLQATRLRDFHRLHPAPRAWWTAAWRSLVGLAGPAPGPSRGLVRGAGRDGWPVGRTLLARPPLSWAAVSNCPIEVYRVAIDSI